MANLDFCDKHNMVAFLKKPEGSEGFHQIVDFLNSTHIKYALTENPTIYVSLIHQFWQTASASTSENGEMEITATIDGRVKTVTEASIRRHLKLEDSDGKGSTVPVESHHTPTSASSISQLPTSPPSMQTTHVVEEAATMPHDSPLLRVHSLGSDEGTHHEGEEVGEQNEEVGEKKVQIGAQTQGRHEHDLEPDFEFTAPEEVNTVEPDISTANVPVSTAGAEVSTASPEVKTAAESLVYIRRSAAKRKDKCKAIMKEVKPVQKKTKLQLEQERLGYEEALRLQEQLDEEERKRISIVHEEANTFNTKEWDNIQAQIEANEELAQKLQAEKRGKFSEAEKNMGSHTLQQLKKLSFDKIKELFETTMKMVKDFVPIESDRLVPKISTGSSKRVVEVELDHEGSKKQKSNEALGSVQE
ncbi:hypothetical protein Tco_1198303 [Tanacetum coccineum]